jgi:hypothetical protein
MKPMLDGAIVYETVVKPGEIIFIPEGWALQVLNLEDSISTGINFLDNNCLWTASYNMNPFQHKFEEQLFGTFFMPLDNPTRFFPEEGDIRVGGSPLLY